MKLSQAELLRCLLINPYLSLPGIRQNLLVRLREAREGGRADRRRWSEWREGGVGPPGGEEDTQRKPALRLSHAHVKNENYKGDNNKNSRGVDGPERPLLTAACSKCAAGCTSMHHSRRTTNGLSAMY